VLILAATLPFLPSITNELVYDDARAVGSNPVVTGELDWLRLLGTDMWGQPAETSHGSYRPLTVLTLVINERVGQGQPWRIQLFHATNVFLHALVVLMAWLVLRRRLDNPRLALLAVLLFAVHALHTENVAYIVGRADLLATALGLLAWRAWDDSRWSWQLVGSLLFGLALLSKEVALAFVLLLFWDSVWQWRQVPRRRHLVRLGTAVAVLAAYIALRMWAVGVFAAPVPVQTNPLVDATMLERVVTTAALTAKALGLLVAPLVLSADYSYAEILPVTTVTTHVVAGVLLWALVPLGAVALRHRRPAVSLGLALLAFAYLPVSNLLFLIPTIFAERLLYLPSLGFCLVAASLLVRLMGRTPRWGWALVVVLLCSHGLRGAQRSQVWQSNERLFADTVLASPNSASAWYNLGVTSLDAGRHDDALRQLTKAVTIMPHWAEAQTNLGVTWIVAHQPERARPHLEAAVRAAPTCGLCVRNLVRFLLLQGQAGEARRQVERFRRAGGAPEAVRELEGLAAARNSGRAVR
jgi:tetratricopeptide (TPR) repeat protein